MIKDKRILVMVGASSALSYKKMKPHSETEETIKHVLRSLDCSQEMKIFGVAGASFVLKHLEKNPDVTEKEAIQKLSNETNSILMNIESQEE
ncbi:MAG: hypothetical protein AABW51_05595 [Nanoarchaeota archaeon]